MNMPVLFPVAMTVWETVSLFTKETPVPGRTISVWGTNPLLVKTMVVTMDAGVAVAVTLTGTAVVTGTVVVFAAGAVTFATIVAVVLTGTTVVATVVGTAVAEVVTSVVAGTVVAVVAGVVVDAVCVHPVTVTSATRRIINPMSSFIWSTHELSIIK